MRGQTHGGFLNTSTHIFFNRFSVASTLKRRFRSLKTVSFENRLQSGQNLETIWGYDITVFKLLSFGCLHKNMRGDLSRLWKEFLGLFLCGRRQRFYNILCFHVNYDFPNDIMFTEMILETTNKKIVLEKNMFLCG